jgi:hypothetical protein
MRLPDVAGGTGIARVVLSEVRRKLRRMVGYTIIDSTSLAEIRDSRDGTGYAILANGAVFELQTDIGAPVV